MKLCYKKAYKPAFKIDEKLVRVMLAKLQICRALLNCTFQCKKNVKSLRFIACKLNLSVAVKNNRLEKAK